MREFPKFIDVNIEKPSFGQHVIANNGKLTIEGVYTGDLFFMYTLSTDEFNPIPNVIGWIPRYQ